MTENICNDYDEIDERLDRVEEQLDYRLPIVAGVVTNQLINPPPSSDYHLSIIFVLADDNANIEHDETIVVSSIEAARIKRDEIQSRRVNQKRKVVIYQRGEQTRNFSEFKQI